MVLIKIILVLLFGVPHLVLRLFGRNGFFRENIDGTITLVLSGWSIQKKNSVDYSAAAMHLRAAARRRGM